MLRILIRRRMLIRTLKKEPYIVEIEKEEHEKLYKAARKANGEIFWDMQRLVENKFIGTLIFFMYLYTIYFYLN